MPVLPALLDPQPSDLGQRAATLELGADDLVVGSVGTRP
jgi:hypothetical protein